MFVKRGLSHYTLIIFEYRMLRIIIYIWDKGNSKRLKEYAELGTAK
jgi:hypothetical protein